MRQTAPVHYIADSEIDAEMDRRLITLLSTCFTKPEDWIFRERRYFTEAPAHHWYIAQEDGGGDLAAHLALHDRVMTAGNQRFSCGGVSEVAVHPRSRGRGYVRLLISTIHAWMESRGYDFAVLFGDPAVYGSSGYAPARNLVRYTDSETGAEREEHFGMDAGTAAFMYYPLSNAPWPAAGTPVDLNGYRF